MSTIHQSVTLLENSRPVAVCDQPGKTTAGPVGRLRMRVPMDDADVARLLKERGYTLGDSAVREDGVFL
jgi:hypothetical protein